MRTADGRRNPAWISPNCSAWMRVRVQLIGHLEPCMTEIYLHIVARTCTALDRSDFCKGGGGSPPLLPSRADAQELWLPTCGHMEERGGTTIGFPSMSLVKCSASCVRAQITRKHAVARRGRCRGKSSH